MTKFKKMSERIRMPQNFDKTKIFIEKCGKKINVYDMIQAANEDCEIYEVLEKYGCIDKIQRNDEKMYADMTLLQNEKGLRGLIEQKQAAEKMFYNLPLEIRAEYNNNINTFTQKAPEKLKEYQKKIEESRKAEELKTTTEMKGNENVTE